LGVWHDLGQREEKCGSFTEGTLKLQVPPQAGDDLLGKRKSETCAIYFWVQARKFLENLLPVLVTDAIPRVRDCKIEGLIPGILIC
jgi:hypothetical protein